MCKGNLLLYFEGLSLILEFFPMFNVHQTFYFFMSVLLTKYYKTKSHQPTEEKTCSVVQHWGGKSVELTI